MTDSVDNLRPPVLLKKNLVVRQTSQGPTVDEVAAQMLRKALKERFPERDIDPDHTLIGTPQWQWDNGTLTAMPIRFESLTQAVVRQFFTATSANYLEGEHFLTTDPQATPVLHLDIGIEAIATLLNDYAPLLFTAFGERQLDYWNSAGHKSTRWQELSDALRKALDVQTDSGWDESQCHVARAVSQFPDKQQRPTRAPEVSSIKACLIDVDTVDDKGETRHLIVGGAAVLTGRYRQRDLVMMYSVEKGYESFDTLESLGASLSDRLPDQLAGRNLKWQLFEPAGNFFDHMAWALIASQLDAIASITSAELAADHTPYAPDLTRADHPRDTGLDDAIPDWLIGASAADMERYSRSVSALGKLYKLADKNLFRIASITTFAGRRMREAILADKKSAAGLPLETLEITITNSFESGGLTLPNPNDTHTETLGEFALQNAAPYQASLRFNPPQTVPRWLNETYLTNMASQVNIGMAYPQLIKEKLINDRPQAALQAQFYIRQLQAVLPLVALENKIRRIAGFNEQGYRYVCEWLKPTPAHPQPVVIRPLTFIRSGESIGDTVDNMFIIGPRQPEAGPCVLYRPLFEQSLMQFPSAQNLLYALHQPGELRDSVLAWLPDAAISFKYAQFTFPIGLPTPWLGAELLLEPWTSVNWAGPVELGSQELSGDVFAKLFQSHAQAMAQLADRQSQSNAERRWALLRDSGWAVFNVAANFLSGPAGAAIWIWQSLTEIEHALEAHQRGDRLNEWSSVGDMLLTLGILLAHHAAVRRKAGPRPWSDIDNNVADLPQKPAVAPAKPVVTLIPTPLTDELPPAHYNSLEASGSIPRRSPAALIAYLQDAAVPAPDLTDPNVQTLRRGRASLYRLNDQLYAQVGEHWYTVIENDDQQLQIVFAGNPRKTGPLLAQFAQGQWVVDTRLRLRGGAGGQSLQNRLRTQRREKEQQRKQLETALNDFKRQEPAADAALQRALDEMLAASGPAHEQATERYLAQVETLIGDYDAALKNLEQWRQKGGSEGYLHDVLRLTTLLQKNLSLWFSLKRNAYASLTHKLVENNEIESDTALQTHIENVRQTLALSQDMVTRLRLSQSSLAALETLGSAGITAAQRLRALLPSFTEWDLKSNEIGMSHELCMRNSANAAAAPERDVVGLLIIEAATATHQHAQLLKTPTATDTIALHIERLSKLIDVYADTDQRLTDLPGEMPDKLEPTQLERIRGLINEFRQLAQDQLNALLPENVVSAPPAPPRPAVAGPSRPAIKVTKSRPREPQSAHASTTTEQPLESVLPPRPRPNRQPPLADIDIVANSLKLVDDVQAFTQQTRKDALRPNRIPADMQDLFDQRAALMERAAADAAQALARIRATGGATPPVGNIGAYLTADAQRLRIEGINLRASMLKQRQPRQAYLQWMLDNHQVQIERNVQGRIRTKKRRDYFQEYRILDVTNKHQPLWLAHFHYDSLEAPLESFTAAHLKIADAHLQQFTAERREALGTLAPIDYVLRRISDPALFFKLEPQP